MPRINLSRPTVLVATYLFITATELLDSVVLQSYRDRAESSLQIPVCSVWRLTSIQMTLFASPGVSQHTLFSIPSDAKTLASSLLPSAKWPQPS